ncbi:uncharacterized protein LOC144138428 isoform X2 [Haemaphysalis longicornis]
MRSRNKGCVIVFFHEEVLKQGTRFGWRPIAEPEDSEAGELTRTGDGPADSVYQRFQTSELACRQPGSVLHLATVGGHGPGGSPHLPRRAGCCLCCFVRAVHAFGGQCSAATWYNDDPRHTSLNGASRVGMAALNPQVLWMSMLTGYFAFLEMQEGWIHCPAACFAE